VRQACAAQAFDGRLEQRGRGREEDRQAAARIAQFLGEIGKAIDVRGIERLVFQPREEAGQLGFVLAVGGQELVERGTGEFAEILV
jgi:hypothetical protein